MKALTITILTSLLLVACGSSSDKEAEGDAMSINKGDVHGTIDGSQIVKSIKHTSHINGEDYNGVGLDLKSGGNITIIKMNKSLTEIAPGALDSPLRKSEVLEENEDYILYKSVKEGFGDDPDETGYNFLMVTEGYRINARGDEMLSDFDTEEKARAALKIARTFKPSK